MDRRHWKQKSEIDGHSQPVPLHVAASLVYHQLNRKLDLGEVVNGALNSTAFALCQVSDVYSLEDGERVAIPRADLAAGAFEESAAIYRAASGRVYRSLSMRRGDLMEAITILRRAR
jgi:hypothetical protein